jgi:AcrR family transcriptional regulator
LAIEDKKRGQGRPTVFDSAIGREALIRATRELLKLHPPTEITRKHVSDYAGVDPNLIRYYFGNMDNLFAEVMAMINQEIKDRLVEAGANPNISPDVRLKNRIDRTFELFIDDPHHHDIVLRYLFGPRKGDVHRDWKRQLGLSLGELKGLLKADGAVRLRKVDERYLHLMIVSLAEFFSKSQPLIKDLFDEEATLESTKGDYLKFLYDVILNGLIARQETSRSNPKTKPSK